LAEVEVWKVGVSRLKEFYADMLETRGGFVDGLVLCYDDQSKISALQHGKHTLVIVLPQSRKAISQIIYFPLIPRGLCSRRPTHVYVTKSSSSLGDLLVAVISEVLCLMTKISEASNESDD
jgi:hypothetical protein